LILLLAAGSNSTSTLNDAEPGLLGFLVVAALGLALVFLLRSMNKQLKKVPDSFDPKHPEPDQAADEGTDVVDEASGQTPDLTDGSARAPGPGDEPG